MLSKEQEQQLMKTAIEYRKNAYAPYSHFFVGAALMTKDGKIFGGCNIENATYTPTNCAERTAFFKAVSEGSTEFDAIAIVGGKEEGTLQFCPPCGVCRQVMMEFCNPKKFVVLLGTSETNYQSFLLEELVPYGFSSKNLQD